MILLQAFLSYETNTFFDVLRSMLVVGALVMAIAVGIRAWRTRSLARAAVVALLLATASDTTRRVDAGEDVVLYLFGLRLFGVAALTYVVWRDPHGARFV